MPFSGKSHLARPPEKPVRNSLPGVLMRIPFIAFGPWNVNCYRPIPTNSANGASGIFPPKPLPRSPSLRASSHWNCCAIKMGNGVRTGQSLTDEAGKNPHRTGCLGPVQAARWTARGADKLATYEIIQQKKRYSERHVNGQISRAKFNSANNRNSLTTLPSPPIRKGRKRWYLNVR